jgi:SAM-dependent methyltransferase
MSAWERWCRMNLRLRTHGGSFLETSRICRISARLVHPLFKYLAKPAYLRIRQIVDGLQDRRLGIVTADQRVRREAGLDPDHYQRFCRAVSFTGIRSMLKHWTLRSDDALLDYGCGAGRVICVAAQYPFSRVIGVEISGYFSRLSERNVRTLRRYLVCPEVVHADAATYQVPDDITVIVIYNSFDDQVLCAVLARVLESIDRVPRRMRVAYVNPRGHALVLSMGRFRERGQMCLSWRPGSEWRRTQTVQFYEVE